MKRLLCLFLALLLAAGMTACHYLKGGDVLEPVDFFYPRQTSNFVYGSASGVIAAEVREASGHIGDLNYLIAMYLRGPQDESLYSPVPAGCTLEKVYTEDDTVHVCLSEEFTALEHTSLTIACAALARTCLSISDFAQITIHAASEDKNVQITLDAESVLFSDHSAFTSQSESE